MSSYINQKGVTHIIVIVLLLVGLAVGLYLIKNPAIFNPRASVSTPVSPQTALSIKLDQISYESGATGRAYIMVASDIDATNLYVAKLTFPTTLLEITGIDTSGSVATYFAEKIFDNTAGTISVIGGLPTPGLKTNLDRYQFAKITFKTKQPGSANLSFSTDSAIYRNSDNVNIVGPLAGSVFSINYPAPTPTASATVNPSPLPSPTTSVAPSPTAVVLRGDGNNDGKIDLVDMSVMFSNWLKPTFPAAINMNPEVDSIINSVDFSMLKTLLINKGILKG